MGKQFTYLLGAGASAKVLPVVSDFEKRLASFRSWMANSQPFKNKPAEPTHIKFLGDLDGFINNLKFTSSPDTLAKRFYLQRRHDKLNDLKMLLSVFFLIEEGYQKFDIRYESLFAQLLTLKDDGNIQLPSNVKILSWNYDLQVERAMNSFLGLHLDHNNSLFNRLQSIPLKNKMGQNAESDIDLDKFALVKLNGMAGAVTNSGVVERFFLEENSTFTKDQLIESVMKIYQAYLANPKDFIPEINFAWEKEGIALYLREQALRVAEQTNVLICIGYSFPNFNRDIDREILGAMKNLDKVYLQDMDSGVKERFQALNPGFSGNVQVIKDVKQFYLPYEY